MIFGKALVGGKLNYYLPLLSAERETGTLDCLDTALNDFLRVMTGLIKTTPIPLLHYFSKIPTLDIMIQQASLRTFKRMNLNTDSLMQEDFWSWDGANWNLTPFAGLHQSSLMMQDKFRSMAQLHDVEDEWLEAGYWTKYSSNKSREMALLTHEQGKLIPKADVYIYTDGSLKSEPVVDDIDNDTNDVYEDKEQVHNDDMNKSGAAGWTIRVSPNQVEVDHGCCYITPASSSYLCEMVEIHQALSRLIELDD